MLRFEVMLPETADPESAFLTDLGENLYPLSSYIDGDRYLVEVPNEDPAVSNSCQVFVSNADGVCEFTLTAGAYEIHTLMVPAGYEGDTETITEAPTNGGELRFTLTKK